MEGNRVSVHFSSVAQSFPTVCDPTNCSTPGLPVHPQHPELTQTHVHESVAPSSHLVLCCHLLLSPTIFPSIRIFSNESVLSISHWPNYWSFSFSSGPSSEYSGLISFTMNWWDSLLSKGLSRISSNTTVQKHQFFSAQLSL